MISRAILIASILLPTLAAADSAKLLGRYGDWESFTYDEKGGKVCYMASQPKKSQSPPKSRGAAYLTITHRTADHSTGVVSVAQGVAYKKDTAPMLLINGAKFELYVSGETAWARNDRAVVAALTKAKDLSVSGVAAKGEAVVDHYSLDGFAKALTEINKACGN